MMNARYDFSIPDDLARALDEISPGFGSRLRRQFKLAEEALEMDAGHRGETELVSTVDLEQNRVTEARDAEDEDHAVTLRQLEEWTTGKKLAEILEECADFDTQVENDVEVTIIATTTILGFFGVSVYLPVGITGQIYSANVVYGFAFILPQQCEISQVIFQISSIAANRNLEIGLYDAAKNLVMQTGVQTYSTTGIKKITITPVTLDAGIYFLAFTADGNVTLSGVQAGTSVIPNFLNANDNRQSQSATASSGGALPAALGTLSSVAVAPPMVWFEA